MTEPRHTSDFSDASDNGELDLLVTCPKGLEPLLADEIQRLGAHPVKTTVAAVLATADHAGAYRLCLWSRLANRVIVRLSRDTLIRTPEQIRDAASRVRWVQHLAPGAPWRWIFTAQASIYATRGLVPRRSRTAWLPRSPAPVSRARRWTTRRRTSLSTPTCTARR